MKIKRVDATDSKDNKLMEQVVNVVNMKGVDAAKADMKLKEQGAQELN